MHVVHSVHGSHEVADSEPRAAPDSHTNNLSLAVNSGFEFLGSLNLITRVAPQAYMNIAHQTNLDSLAGPTIVPGRNWRADLLVTHRQHRLALIPADVQ